jgi:tetratricopeptide (TPR) repeat protein
MKLPPGRYQYKFTRGVWSTVEGLATGLDIPNRVLDVNRDTTVNIVIEGWMDKFKDINKFPDSIQWNVAYSRSFFYLDTNLDSSYKYAQHANALLDKLNNKKYEGDMARILGRIMQRQGNHERALEYYLEQLSIVQQLKDTLSMAFCLLDIGNIFLAIKDFQSAKNYYSQVTKFDLLKTEAFGRSAPNLAFIGIGRVYYNTHQLDSARFYALRSYEFSLSAIDRQGQSEALTLLGDILADENRTNEAIKYYLLAIEQAKLFNSLSIVTQNYQNISRAFYTVNQLDSSLTYARKGLVVANQVKNPNIIINASSLLVNLFKSTGQTDSAFKYLETVVAAKDSLFSQNKDQQLQTILFNEELQKQELKSGEEKLKSQVKTYIMAGGIILLLILCIFLWWNNRQKQHINTLLNQQGEKMQKTLNELKATKSQLTQKEKMASFGVFAAGIAVDIKEPLSSINEVSQNSIRKINELKRELAGLNSDPAKQQNLKAIADELIQSQEKVIEQGQQAEDIVKGMLQHSGNTSEDSLLI